jgi:hypothetical protein
VDVEEIPGLCTSRVTFKGRLGQVTALGTAANGHEVVYTVVPDDPEVVGITGVGRSDLKEEWYDDSYQHIRHFWRSPGAIAARQYVEASRSERICREGRCWHLYGDTPSMKEWAFGAGGDSGRGYKLPRTSGVE